MKRLTLARALFASGLGLLLSDLVWITIIPVATFEASSAFSAIAMFSVVFGMLISLLGLRAILETSPD